MLAAGAAVAAIVSMLGLVPGIGAVAARALFGMPDPQGPDPQDETPHEDSPWAELTKIRPIPLAGRVIRTQHRANLIRRAQYLLAAGRRLGTAVVRQARTPGSVSKALATERRYLRQHLDATRKRIDAAAKVDQVWQQETAKSGMLNKPGLLGWLAVMDDRTSAECRAAHRRNFDPLRPPPIGLPGTVHPDCRCKAGPAWNTDRMVDSIPLEVAAANDGTFVMRVIQLSGDHSSSTHPDLKNKPGKTNWVEKTGGLPAYIKRVAKHIAADSGLSEGHAIAAAHNWCVKQAAKGNAEAAAAIAQWNAQAAAARASK